MTSIIFVTGGVVSSVGKGVTVASIGRILKSRGISVSLMKLDPYLNVDPGTMSPYQHGEVFVTEDGSETDLDLGHYERFVDVNLTKLSNITAGQIYSDVIARERRGEFLGGTIQAVPHVTDAIKQCILNLAQDSHAEVVVVEVGGTVGDIEGLPFLEAIRQMRNEVGRDNVLYIHVTFLPYISSTGELKTKPTQHSVRDLRGIGIQPDAIVCRSDHDVDDDIKRKISVHCDVPGEAVLTLPTVSSIYEVPLILQEEGLGDFIVDALDLRPTAIDLIDWRMMVEAIAAPKPKLPIAIVGKYVDLPDSYISVKEALLHAGLEYDRDVEVNWVNSEQVEDEGPDGLLASAAGIVVPGGFGPRGVEGMIRTVEYARRLDVPYLGLCLGLQVMVVEIARSLLKLPDANSTEMDASHLPSCHRPHAEPEGSDRHGRHHAARPLPVRDGPWELGCPGLRYGGRPRAPPSPLGGQQRLPRELRVGRSLAHRHLPGRKADRDHGVHSLKVHAGHPVPPRVQVQAQQAASTVQGVHRSRYGCCERGRATPFAVGVRIVRTPSFRRSKACPVLRYGTGIQISLAVGPTLLTETSY